MLFLYPVLKFNFSFIFFNYRKTNNHHSRNDLYNFYKIAKGMKFLFCFKHKIKYVRCTFYTLNFLCTKYSSK